MPSSVTCLKQTPLFERCVDPRTHNYFFLSKEAIGLSAQYMLITFGITVNIIGGGDLYDHLMSTRIFIVIMIGVYI